MRSRWKARFHFSSHPVPTTGGAEIRSRASYVLPSDVGVRVSIHDGRKFNSIQVRSSMVGLKFGSFFVTKRLGGIHTPAPSSPKTKKKK